MKNVENCQKSFFLLFCRIRSTPIEDYKIIAIPVTESDEEDTGKDQRKAHSITPEEWGNFKQFNRQNTVRPDEVQGNFESVINKF